jgi:hypothetical protein
MSISTMTLTLQMSSSYAMSHLNCLLPFRSLPSRSRPFRSSATFLPYHTVNNHSRPILDCQIIPRRTAKIHYEPFHDCQSLSIRYRPFRASTRHCCRTSPYLTHPLHSTPWLPYRTTPCLSNTVLAAAALPHLIRTDPTYPIPTFTTAPIQASCLTRTDLAVSHRNFPRLDCPTKPRQTKPLVT